MSQQLLDSISQRAAALDERYNARFAGYSRLTRDLGEMDELIRQAKGLLAEAADLSGTAAAGVRENLQKQADLYEQERQHITAAKEMNEESKQAILLAAQANHLFHIYRRHFAGFKRDTRDLGLLNELIVELEKVEDAMDTLTRRAINKGLNTDLTTVRQNLEMYRNERGAIEQARAQGKLSEQADRLAELANEQFALYQKHFANRSRLTRRASLLERIINSLDVLAARMRAQQAELRDQTLGENVNVIAQQLTFYREELKKIREARATRSPEELSDGLAGEANSIMEEYRQHFAGQNRTTRDLSRLVVLLDRLQDVERLMSALAAERDLPSNARNLQIVRDNMTLFEREHDEIKKIQAAPAK